MSPISSFERMQVDSQHSDGLVQRVAIMVLHQLQKFMLRQMTIFATTHQQTLRQHLVSSHDLVLSIIFQNGLLMVLHLEILSFLIMVQMSELVLLPHEQNWMYRVEISKPLVLSVQIMELLCSHPDEALGMYIKQLEYH